MRSQPTLVHLLLYFAKLGATGFGGPIVLAGAMQRDLVERRGWYTPDEYREGLALAQLAPGPLAAQLAIYLGWARFGFTGATLAALAFVLPSFAMVLALSAAYVRFGGIFWMQGAFKGIGAAVIALIARSAWNLIRGTVKPGAYPWGVCLVSAAVTAWTESEIVWLFLLAGAGALAWKRLGAKRSVAGAAALLPAWWVAGLHGPAPPATLAALFWYFAEAGAFVFGSGLAIVPFLHGGVVDRFGWLTDRQFLDAVAVAMITPGPVVITVGFIGYLVGGPAGAVLAGAGVFLPCYLFVIIPAPWFRRYAANESLRAFVDGVTAAAIGAIAGAALVLGRRALAGLPACLIAGGTLVAASRLRRVPEAVWILGAGLLGQFLS